MKKSNYRAMAVLCCLVILLVATAAAIGVFFRGDMVAEEVVSVRGEHYEMVTEGIYRHNPLRLVAEGVGWDVFTLFVAVPAGLIALPALAKGSLRARLFMVGVLAYFFYQYLMYAMAWAFGPLFLLFIGIYALSLVGALWIGFSVDIGDLQKRVGGAFPRRGIIVLNLLLSLILLLMWLQRIMAGLKGDLETAMLLGQTTLVVQALDLGLVVPAAVFTALAVWRRQPVGYLLSSIFIVKAVAMAAAIISMLLVVWLTDGTLEVIPLVIFGAALIAAVLLGLRVFQNVTAPDSH